LTRTAAIRKYVSVDPKKIVVPHIFVDGSLLLGIRKRTLDFIIANHFLEHLRNPVASLVAWAARLKIHGTLILAVPDHDLIFDKLRTVTPISHLLYDFILTEAESARSDENHMAAMLLAFRREGYPEHQRSDDEIRKQARNLYQSNDGGVHYHTFTVSSLIELLITVALFIPFKIKAVFDFPQTSKTLRC